MIRLLPALIGLVCLTGCFSPTRNTIREYDASGRLTRETVTSESVVKTVADSTRGKTVLIWDNSWLAYLSATTSTAEDVSPTVKMGVGKTDRGALTLPEKHSPETAAELIRAARSGGINVSAGGIGTTSGKE